MRKIKIILLFIMVTFLAVGCIDNKIMKKEISLDSIGSQGDIRQDYVAFQILDNSFMGLRSLCVKKSVVSNLFSDYSKCHLNINGTYFYLNENPFNNNILEVDLPDSLTEENIRKGILTTSPAKKNTSTSARSGISIDSIVIQKEEAQNNSDLFRIAASLFISMRNANIFVFNKQGDFIIPSYIFTSEENCYMVSTFISARNASPNPSINGTFEFLKSLQNHNELLQHINPNTARYENGKIVIYPPNGKKRLRDLGSEGELNLQSSVYKITDLRGSLGLWSVAFRKSRLPEPEKNGTDWKITLKNTEYLFTQNIVDGDIYELTIPDSITNDIEEIRNSTFETVEDQVYTLTIEASPTNGGDVRIGTEEWGDNKSKAFNSGESVTIEASCSSDYLFDGWYENQTMISSDNPCSITVNADRNIKALFKQKVISTTPEMVEVKSGSFRMGNTRNDSEGHPDEKPIHSVTLTYDYYIGKYEITNEQFLEFLNDAGVNPTGELNNHKLIIMDDLSDCEIEFSNNQFKLKNSKLGKLKYPVFEVTWWGAIEYCNWLSIKEGLPKVYDNGMMIDYPDNNGYRLPTEAEWEYAARGGNSEIATQKYSGSNNINKVGWYWDNSINNYYPIALNKGSQKVGTKSENILGIYDMSGNVTEWCYDWYGSYSSYSEKNPLGEITPSEHRVKRGGGWNSKDQGCRISHRNHYYDNELYSNSAGFRIVRTKNISQHTLTVEASPTTGGDVRIGTEAWGDNKSKTFNSVESVTIEARTNDGYTFDGWYENSIKLTDNNIYSFEIKYNRKIKANFIKIIPLQFVEIPAGTFMMGDTRNEGSNYEKPVHQVTLTYDYEIGKYEVTNAQFLEFLNNSSVTSTGQLNGHEIIDMNDSSCEIKYANGQFSLKKANKIDYPVIKVAWWGAIEYCNWLSEKEGLSKAYNSDGTLTDYPNNKGYRLPTEAEWEYAARGGENDNNTSTDYKYAGSNDINEVAWYNDNSNDNTHKVGQKNANEKGIHDMSGNVYEWCSGKSYAYTANKLINPIIVAIPETRTFRGGSYKDKNDCRISDRGSSSRTIFSYPDVGFRIVRTKNISQHTLTIEASPTTGGDVRIGTEAWGDSKSKTFNSGDSVTIEASATSGYTFDGWYKDGVKESPDNPYTFNINETKTLKANFINSSNFVIEGIIEDSNSNKIPDSKIVCNCYDVNNINIFKSETQSSANGNYYFTLNNNSNSIEEITITIIKEGFEITDKYLSINDVVDSKIVCNAELKEIQINPSEKLDITIDLPVQVTEQIAYTFSIDSEVPVINGKYSTKKKTSLVENEYLYSEDGRILGIATTDGKTDYTINVENIIVSAAIELITLNSLKLTIENYDEISQKIKNTPSFNSAVNVYQQESVKANFDMYECIEIYTKIIDVVNEIEVTNSSKRAVAFNNPEIKNLCMEDNKLKFTVINEYPLNLFVAKSDGELIGVANGGEYASGLFNFEYLNGETTFKTSKVFEEYIDKKELYFFIGIGNNMPNVPSSIRNKFETYNKWANFFNLTETYGTLLTHVTDIIFSISSEDILNVISQDIQNFLSDLENEEPDYESILKILETLADNKLKWRDYQKISGLMCSICYWAAKKINPNITWNIGTVSKVAKKLRNSLKLLKLITEASSALKTGAITGKRMRYYFREDEKPEKPWGKIEDTGYYSFNKLIIPETINKNTENQYSFEGFMEGNWTNKYKFRWDFDNNGIWDYEDTILKPVKWTYTTTGNKTIKISVSSDFGTHGELKSSTTTTVYVGEIAQKTLTVEASPTNGGDVRIGTEEWGDNKSKTFNSGDSVTIEASATSGYVFEGWYKDGVRESTDNPYTFNINETKTLKANFKTQTVVTTPEMIHIPAGTFKMGNTRDDSEGSSNEKPVHQVILTYDYEIGKYEVTNAQFLEFLNNSNVTSTGQLNGHEVIDMNGSYCEIEYTNGKFNLKSSKAGKENYPVIVVTWWGAMEYCNWLSEKQGLTKAYNNDGSLNNYPNNKGYRLPTEAEWEYAARGGENDNNTSTDYKYAGSNDIDDVAWYYYNSQNPEHPVSSGRGTHQVGTKAPNERGIYDMSGNVCEWCQDYYNSEYYRISPIENPLNTSSYSGRILRGGYWHNSADRCRVAVRRQCIPDHGDRGLGFRLARTKSENTSTKFLIVESFPINSGVVRIGTDAWGTTGNKTFNSGESVTIEASATSGYVFEGWYKNGVKESPDNHYTFNINETKMLKATFKAMIHIPSGTFMMGNTRDDSEGNSDEKPVHQVTLTYDYEIGKYEVTNAQFLEFLNDSAVTSTGQLNGHEVIDMDNGNCEIEYSNNQFRLKQSKAGKENYPVIEVTWWGGMEYCNWLSKEYGLSKAYNNDGTLINYPSNKGYRLPTEAEWEYAARGGENDNNTSTDYKYAGSNNIDEVAWYGGNFTGGTHYVGTKEPNEKGIYDMSGNVWEWCQDYWNSEYYSISPVENPLNTSSSSYRVSRGGGWNTHFARSCRVADRSYNDHDYNHDNLGFRIVRTK